MGPKEKNILNLGLSPVITTTSTLDGKLGITTPLYVAHVSRYLIVGSSLLFTMIVFTMGTQAKSLFLMTLQAIKRRMDQRTGHVLNAQGRVDLFRESITHCSIQEELEELYVGGDVIPMYDGQIPYSFHF